MGNYVPGKGSSTAKLMVVGEAPGAEEDLAREPFVGKVGGMTREMLHDAGNPSCYFTNVFKYRPPDNDIKRAHLTGHRIEDGLPELWNEIKAIQPNCILALGRLSLETLTGKKGIEHYRGSILTALDGHTKVVPTIHPGAIFRAEENYSALAYIRLDFQRAVEESKTADLILPERTLEIARSSLDVFNFFERYAHLDLAAADIETLKSAIPTCISFAFSPRHAISIPLISPDVWTKKNTFNIPVFDMFEIWREVVKQLNRLRIIGQNFKFDIHKLFGIGISIPNFYADTSLMQHVAYPEMLKRLEFTTSIYTREPYYKDEGREFNPKFDSADQHFVYNARDSAVTYEVYEALLRELDDVGMRDFYFDYEHKLNFPYIEMERRGFKFNAAKRQAILDKYEVIIEKEEKILNDIAGYELNARSPTKIAIFLEKELKLPPRGSTDEETLVALLANHAKQPKQQIALEQILKLRGLHKAVSSTLDACPDFDGRMRTSVNIGGTETGRSSNNILKPPNRPIKIGLGFQTVPKHGDYGTEMRECLEPDDGKILVQIDMSQAEARMVALLARDEYLLNLFATGQDVHSITASWFFDKPPSQITKDERFVGKGGRHGGGYDEHKRRLMLTINTDAKKYKIAMNPISEWRAGKILEKFHQHSPNIRAVFHREIREALEHTRTLVNAYGRRRYFFGRMESDLFREGYANIPQSTVRDHMGWTMLQIYKEEPRIEILMESHDALVFQAPRDVALDLARYVKKILERPISFERCTLSRGELVIPADVEIGENLRDLEKVKV